MAEEAEGRAEHIEAAARVWAWARWERQWREGERQGRKGRYTYLGDRRRAVSRAGRRRRDGTGSANCSDETA